MILSQDRYQLRKLFFDSWNKFVNNTPLTALEEQIVRIIELHQEYHKLFTLENIDKD
ncbi:DUF1841 family protein, partial [Francisella tularensis subsp. holarctica]|uniref:DUF1841 family protein n=1 Tax=Francisella tularensis TaxID=263 RepID=UPI0023819A5F